MAKNLQDLKCTPALLKSLSPPLYILNIYLLNSCYQFFYKYAREIPTVSFAKISNIERILTMKKKFLGLVLILISLCLQRFSGGDGSSEPNEDSL